MKKIILLVLLCIIGIDLYSQKIGQWNPLFSYEADIDAIAQSDELVYALVGGKLFSYNPLDDSIETYSKMNGDDITNITYSKKHKCLIVVRADGDIDLMYTQNRTTNISSLKNVVGNLDKKVNEISIHGDYAYLSANFGLLVLNLAKEEVKESVITRYPFYSSCIHNDYIYISTNKGVKRINASSNIQDINTWEEITLQDKYIHSDAYNFVDTDIRQFMNFDGKLIFIVPSKSVYFYDGNTVDRVQLGYGHRHQSISITNDILTISQRYSFAIMANLAAAIEIPCNDLNVNLLLQDKDNSNLFWVSALNKNLVAIKMDPVNRTFTIEKEFLKPLGPLSNYPFFMTHDGEKLLVTGGKVGTDNSWFPARLSEFSGNKWFNYDKAPVDAAAGRNSEDFVSVASDPNDPNHLFVCTWTVGVVEFKNRQLVKVYNEKNSSLTPAYGNVVRTQGACFDKNGVFWFGNDVPNQSKIVAIEKGGNSLIELKYNALLAKTSNLRQIVADRYNNKWLTTYAGTSPYLFIFNENKTLSDMADDKTKIVTDFYTQDKDKLSIGDFHAIAEDLNGNMWLGTNIGIFVAYNSTQVFDKDLILNKIKIPKDDGTADILLESIPVRAIAVDGANRKWIGTSVGLYVVSANGQETIHHFTIENSMLPSNSILSLAIDQKTGVVYIGTENGIVSYKGEASEGKENFSNVHAYPNPVEPDYQGAITITGLMVNSTVKITDVKGNLINEGKSLGGQYIWDGRNVKRERVATGAYLVFGSSEDGKNGVVTKIMVITD